MMGSPTMRRALVALLLLPLALGVQRLAGLYPQAVEAYYSRCLFPRVVRALAWGSSLVPFSLAEVVLFCGGALVLGLTLLVLLEAARGKGQRGRILGRAVLRSLFVAGLGYVLFLLTWGFNYQRVSLAGSAGFAVQPSSKADLVLLSGELLDAANLWRDGLPEDEQGVLQLTDGVRSALDRTGLGVAAVQERYPWMPRPIVRPKGVWMSPLLSRLGIAGFYFPWTAEAQVNIEMPPSEVPFAAAHEVAHQLGYSREDEANFLGYLACRLHPDALFRYSGLFVASRHVQRALASVDEGEARGLESRRSLAVRRDLTALAAWAERHRGPAMRIAHRVNDAHLKVQGQRDGTRSYGRMVDLLLAERRALREPRETREDPQRAP